MKYTHIRNAHSREAGKTFYWLGEDNEENFQRHALDPTKKDLLRRSGWFDQIIVYEFNTNGFRSVEFQQSIENICFFGCSMTFGVGIKQEQRYTDIVAANLGMQCYNFGISGGSDSTSIRLALTWLCELRPRIVIYQKTFMERFELIEDGWSKILGINAALGGNVAIGRGDLYKTWMINAENYEILAEKNRLAMQSICRDLGCKLIEISYQDFFGEYDTMARDTHHPGPHANLVVAEKIKTQL